MGVAGDGMTDTQSLAAEVTEVPTELALNGTLTVRE